MAAEVNKPDFSYQWASGGAIVAPSNVKVQTGWTAEVPPFQWENYLQNRQDNAIVHLFQKGISEWDSASDYYFTASGVRSYVQGSDGNIYVALQDSIGQNPTTSPTYWSLAFATASNTYTKAQVDAKFITSKVVFITSSGTYTPTPGMKAAFVQVQAAGGGGGGSQGNATGGAAAAGGSAGGYSEGYFTAATIGASQAVTVGAAGPGGAGPAGSGSAGGASSFGALLTATGGSFGAAGATSGATARGPAPSVTGGGTGSTQIGQNGGIGIVFGPLNAAIAGAGGSSRLGVGGQGRNEGSNGFTGTGYGSGGAGAASSTINQNGGPGGPGVVIVTEYF